MSTFHALLHAPRWRHRWRVLLLGLLVVVTWLALTPHPPQNPMDQGDKFDHVLAFGTLGLIAALAGAPRRGRLATAAGGLLLYGGMIELAQTQLPPRSGEWLDLLADAAGIALGLATATLLRRLQPPRR
jgi:VanZ family protein